MKVAAQDTYGSPEFLKLRKIDKPDAGHEEALVRVLLGDIFTRRS